MIEVSEEDNGPVEKLLEGHDGRERQDRVLRYMARRLEKGESLDDVKNAEYVQRNVTLTELDRICRDPRLVEASREGMEEHFEETPPGQDR